LERFANFDGDHFTLLNIYNQYIRENKSESWCNANFFDPKALERAMQLREDLKKIYLECGFKINDKSDSPDYVHSIKKSLIHGYIKQVTSY
jgi:HrpA-like RNA helicase